MTLLTLQVETMKKAHHAACKEEKLATSRENTGKMENNAEAQKKLQDKVEKSQQETEKVRRPPAGYNTVSEAFLCMRNICSYSRCGLSCKSWT